LLSIGRLGWWKIVGRLPIRRAAAIHLAKIRAIVLRDLAEEANLQEPEKFTQAWHMLTKGSIVSAGEGNRNAARDAKCAAQLVLEGWKRGLETPAQSGGRARQPILTKYTGAT
jgi:hypothetical protein